MLNTKEKLTSLSEWLPLASTLLKGKTDISNSSAMLDDMKNQGLVDSDPIA